MSGDRLRRSLGGAALLVAALLALAPAAPAAGPPGGLDARAWELVSPVDKNGGEVGSPGTAAADLLQGAVQGGALAYGSAFSFGEAEGSLPVNQYIATRGGGGWSTENLTPPALSGTYAGGAYQLFSEDLSRAVLASGDRCRGGALLSCEAEGPPLGPGAPPGYRNLYLRQGATYAPLITAVNSPSLATPATAFRLFAAGGSPDLSSVVISTCSALVAGAVEAPSGEGCDEAAQNLYRWHEGQLALVNVLPGESESAPGATLASPDAVSEDGSRVYFSHGGDLYLREGAQTKLVAEGASFDGASADGSLVIYLKASHLHRYDASAEASTDLTPSGGAVALLGASADANTLYYLAGDGLYRRLGTTNTKLISATPAQLPPAAGTSLASVDGARLFFDSAVSLLGTDTDGAKDVYEWEAQGAGSCTRAGGCLGLASSGREGSAALAGASASGDDVFFATAVSLLAADPGSLDLYDARSGGGFPEAESQICLGDDCQGPAPEPDWVPAPTSSLQGIPNPPVRFAKHKHRAKKQEKKKGHKKHQKQRHHHSGRRR